MRTVRSRQSGGKLQSQKPQSTQSNVQLVTLVICVFVSFMSTKFSDNILQIPVTNGQQPEKPGEKPKLHLLRKGLMN
jgi:hypothetical protein